jgi:hypothetical protein
MHKYRPERQVQRQQQKLIRSKKVPLSMGRQVHADAVYAPSEDVVAREIAGELVLVPLASGVGDIEDALYSLNETGRVIWDRLDGQMSLRGIAAELSQEYEAPIEEIEADVMGLVQELFRRNMLIEISEI